MCGGQCGGAEFGKELLNAVQHVEGNLWRGLKRVANRGQSDVEKSKY